MNLPPATRTILVDSANRPVMVEYPQGKGTVVASLTEIERMYAFQNKKLLANEIAYQDITPVPVDIKPLLCPNPLVVGAPGVVSAAVLGTANFDVTSVDPATIRLAGVPPLRSALQDVAAPFTPYLEKMSTMDCTSAGADGFTDLVLKFDNQTLLRALGPINDGDVLVLKLTGKLNPQFRGKPLVGEDVVVINKPACGAIARGDSYTMTQGTVLTVPEPGVLANDTIPPKVTATVEFVTFPPAGLTNLGNGSGGFILDFRPNPTFVGTAAFNYLFHTPKCDSNIATVTVQVTPAP